MAHSIDEDVAGLSVVLNWALHYDASEVVAALMPYFCKYEKPIDRTLKARLTFKTIKELNELVTLKNTEVISTLLEHFTQFQEEFVVLQDDQSRWRKWKEEIFIQGALSVLYDSLYSPETNNPPPTFTSDADIILPDNFHPETYYHMIHEYVQQHESFFLSENKELLKNYNKMFTTEIIRLEKGKILVFRSKVFHLFKDYDWTIKQHSFAEFLIEAERQIFPTPRLYFKHKYQGEEYNSYDVLFDSCWKEEPSQQSANYQTPSWVVGLADLPHHRSHGHTSRETFPQNGSAKQLRSNVLPDEHSQNPPSIHSSSRKLSGKLLVTDDYNQPSTHRQSKAQNLFTEEDADAHLSQTHLEYEDSVPLNSSERINHEPEDDPEDIHSCSSDDVRSALEKLKKSGERESKKRKSSSSSQNQTSSRSPEKQKRFKWTDIEDAALLAGVERHGVSSWQAIIDDPEFKETLSRRSNVKLKDRWRSMQKQKDRQGEEE